MALFLGAKKGDVAAWSSTADLIERFREQLKAESSGMESADSLAMHHRYRDEIREELQREQWYRDAFRTAAERIAAAEGPDGLRSAIDASFDHAADYFRLRRSVVAAHCVCTAAMDLAVQAALFHAERLLAAAGRTAPAPWSWLAYGDHGRRECTLNRELSGILCWDGMPEGSSGYFSTLAGMATTMLLEGGLVNRDTVLPSNPVCRGSLDEWNGRLAGGRGFASNPALLADLRHLHGAPGPAVSLVRMAKEKLLSGEEMRPRSRRRSLHDIARMVASHPAGIDLFGRFRTEKSGPYQKRFNLGKYGIEPLINSVRLLAICRDITATGTIDRIKSLQEKERLGVDLAERLLTTYHEFLQFQLENEANGIPPEGGRFLDVGALTRDGQHRLESGLEAVEQLQMIVHQSLEHA